MRNRTSRLPVEVQLQVGEDAAKILNSATQAVAKILERRAELDRQGRHNEPLVVVAGESHASPSHYIHHMAVIDKLLDVEKSTAVAYEVSDANLTQNFSHFAGSLLWSYKASPDISDEIEKRDPKGNLALKAFLGYRTSPTASHSRTTLFKYLLDKDAIFRFTDATNNGDSLDPDDRSTAESMHACFGRVTRNMSPITAEGLFVRNHHMVGSALNLAKEHNSRIVFQICGAAHVAGEIFMHPDSTQGLSALFKKAGAPVIAMPILGKRFNERSIPANDLTPDEKHYIDGIPEAIMVYDPRKNRGLHAVEAEYVNALLEGTELDEHKVSRNEYISFRDQCKGEADSTFRKWKDEFHPPVWTRAMRFLGLG